MNVEWVFLVFVFYYFAFISPLAAILMELVPLWCYWDLSNRDSRFPQQLVELGGSRVPLPYTGLVFAAPLAKPLTWNKGLKRPLPLFLMYNLHFTHFQLAATRICFTLGSIGQHRPHTIHMYPSTHALGGKVCWNGTLHMAIALHAQLELLIRKEKKID